MRTISLSQAHTFIDAAIGEATKRSLFVSVAVLDAGANLIAFSRMDKAEIAGPLLAIDKAYTAVMNRITTEELGKLSQPGAEFYGIQNNGGGRFVIFGGGIPLWDDDVVIGAIGVSGASAADDAACAKVAASLWS